MSLYLKLVLGGPGGFVKTEWRFIIIPPAPISADLEINLFNIDLVWAKHS